MTGEKFFRGHKRRGSYNLFSTYNHYAPGFDGVIMLLILLMGGYLLSYGATNLLSSIYGEEAVLKYGNLISYPLLYIPALLYASVRSRLMDHGGNGIPMDSDNYGTVGGFKMTFVAFFAMIAAAVVIEPIALLLPEMSAEFEVALKMLMEVCPFWVTFIAASIFAPFFEEWLCRGIILRGLLSKHHPAVAILVSAAFFGFIHLNIWQGVPAFFFGVLLGYVYYKTGSMKLVMLMHFTNNTLALILSRIPEFNDKMLMETMSIWGYAGLYACMAIALIMAIIVLRAIPARDNIKPEKTL